MIVLLSYYIDLRSWGGASEQNALKKDPTLKPRLETWHQENRVKETATALETN